MEKSQQKQLYEGPSACLTSIFSQPTISRCTGMFDGLGDNWDTPLSPYDSSISPSHGNPELIVPTGVTLLSDNTAEKWQQLEQQYQELVQQVKHIDEFGEDDDSLYSHNHDGGQEGKRDSLFLFVWLI